MVERARIDAGFGFKVHPQMLGTPAANHHHVGGGVIEMELTDVLSEAVSVQLVVESHK